MNDVLFTKIYQQHIKQLKNVFCVNKKLLVCFSGVPGSGKTTLAKKLERKYKGVRINTDDLRDIFDMFGIKNREKELDDYLFHFFETAFQKNI